MNPNLISVVSFGVGVILIYSAIKKEDPRTVVKKALGGRNTPVNTSPPTPSPAVTPANYVVTSV